MVLPLWRSLHSLNLMLPKEERRAMLLRFFNDETPLINTTNKRQRIETSTPPPETDGLPMPLEALTEDVEEYHAPPEAEDKALMAENLDLGEDQQEQTDARETWTKDGDEVDRFNTTV